MAMKKFEYLDDIAYADVQDSDENFQDYLDKMGQEGWELVTMIVMEESLESYNYKHCLIWKRELEK